MNRFWVRILVFCGLLGTAGVVWGVLECGMFTRNGFNYMDGPKSNAAFAYPIALILVLAAAWLAALCVFHDRWKTAEALTALLAPLGFNMGGFMIAPALSTLDSPCVWACTMAGLILGLVALLIAISIHYRRVRRTQPKPVQPHWRQSAPAFLILLIPSIAWWLYAGHSTEHGFYRICAFGGLSLPTAWQMADLTGLNLGAWFLDSILSGAVVGVWFGFFLSMTKEQNAPPRRHLRVMAVCGVLGIVVSSMMYGAHAILLLKTYAVAWNGGALLPTALLVWGVLGTLFGLMLASAVRILSTPDPAMRGHRLSVSLAIIIPLIVLGTGYALSFVRRSSAGLDLLQQAARLEGQALCIGFNSDGHQTGLRQIVAQTNGIVSTRHQQAGYARTIEACNKLTEHYPESAFTSAALYLKFKCCHSAWQPAESQMAMHKLESSYPPQGYDASRIGARVDGTYKIGDLMLAGDYEGVLRIVQTDPAGQAEMLYPGATARAAEALGRWDVAVQARKAVIAWYGEEPRRPSARRLAAMAEARARLQRDESMQARHAPPALKTDVAGRLLFAGRPLPNTTVCLIPSDRMPAMGKEIDPATAGLHGGRIARTDGSGCYTIQAVPSGKYALVLLVDPIIVPKTVNIRAPGVPYEIRGRAVRLPDIVLTPRPAK